MADEISLLVTVWLKKQKRRNLYQTCLVILSKKRWNLIQDVQIFQWNKIQRTFGAMKINTQNWKCLHTNIYLTQWAQLPQNVFFQLQASYKMICATDYLLVIWINCVSLTKIFLKWTLIINIDLLLIWFLDKCYPNKCWYDILT